MGKIQSTIDSVSQSFANAYVVHQARKDYQKGEKEKTKANKKKTDAIVKIAENMEWLRNNAITRADMLKKNRETAVAQTRQRKHKFDADVAQSIIGGYDNE